METPQETPRREQDRMLDELWRQWWLSRDPHLFESIAETLYRRLRRIVWKQLNNVDSRIVDDIVQEVLKAAVERRDRCSGDVRGFGWLARVAYKKCADFIEHQRPRPGRPRIIQGLDAEMLDVVKSRDEGMSDPGMLLDITRDCLARMILDQKTTPGMRTVMGVLLAVSVVEPDRQLKLKEIARMSGCSVDAVTKRMRGIRKILKACIEETLNRFE